MLMFLFFLIIFIAIYSFSGPKDLPKLYMMNPTNNTDYYGTPYPFGVDPVRI